MISMKVDLIMNARRKFFCRALAPSARRLLVLYLLDESSLNPRCIKGVNGR
jgi:hypothetical protein